MLETVRKAVHDTLAENQANLAPKAIASRMNVALSLLYSWGESGEYGRDIPIERLVQFTLITEDGRALSELCAVAGYSAVPVPSFGRCSGAEPEAIKALHEFSEFMQENSRALLDGLISDTELAKIEKEGNEAMLAIAKVIEVSRRQREAGKVSR